MSLTLTARLSTRLHGLVQLVARHTRHRRPRVGTWYCGQCSCGLWSVQAQECVQQIHYMDTTDNYIIWSSSKLDLTTQSHWCCCCQKYLRRWGWWQWSLDDCCCTRQGQFLLETMVRLLLRMVPARQPGRESGERLGGEGGRRMRVVSC